MIQMAWYFNAIKFGKINVQMILECLREFENFEIFDFLIGSGFIKHLIFSLESQNLEVQSKNFPYVVKIC